MPTKDPKKKAAKKIRNAAKRKETRKLRAKEGRRQHTISNVPDKLWPVIQAAVKVIMDGDSKGGRDV